MRIDPISVSWNHFFCEALLGLGTQGAAQLICLNVGRMDCAGNASTYLLESSDWDDMKVMAIL